MSVAEIVLRVEVPDDWDDERLAHAAVVARALLTDAAGGYIGAWPELAGLEVLDRAAFLARGPYDDGAAVARRHRERVRRAVDDALASGALSEDWAGSVYANLDEPPAEDVRGWAILIAGAPS